MRSCTGVSLRTTHASWVFLTDGDAWKVKRPVDFGFLDFRTLEARRRACEDEVRLNRRLAPGVYLGVEPVRSSPDGFSLQGAGPIADWAVHMRRLPDGASAEAMLGRGLLRPERLAALAKRLAAFLADARPTPELGGPQVLRHNVDENFAQVAPFVGDLVDRATFDDVRAFQLGALAAHADRFVARVGEGRIRDGHGDLRLEHVYFLPEPDGIVAIDCIEFNDRFRCGDAAGEAAFLAMELEAARCPDLAAGFLARFAEESDDFGLYGVVDFYLSYRAWVRGKVAAFLASDATEEAALRTRKRDEARRQFALARSFSGAPVDAPFVVAVGGIVGKRQEHAGDGAGTGAGRAGGQLGSDAKSGGRVGGDGAGRRPPVRARSDRPKLCGGLEPRPACAGIRARRHPGCDLPRAAPAGGRRGAGAGRGRAVCVPRGVLCRRRGPARASRRAPRTALRIRRHRRRAGRDPATPGTARRGRSRGRTRRSTRVGSRRARSRQPCARWSRRASTRRPRAARRSPARFAAGAQRFGPWLTKESLFPLSGIVGCPREPDSRACGL